MDRRRALGIGLVVVAGRELRIGIDLRDAELREGLDWLTLLGWRFLIGAGLAWAWVAAVALASRGPSAVCHAGSSR